MLKHPLMERVWPGAIVEENALRAQSKALEEMGKRSFGYDPWARLFLAAGGNLN